MLLSDSLLQPTPVAAGLTESFAQSRRRTQQRARLALGAPRVVATGLGSHMPFVADRTLSKTAFAVLSPQNVLLDHFFRRAVAVSRYEVPRNALDRFEVVAISDITSFLEASRSRVLDHPAGVVKWEKVCREERYGKATDRFLVSNESTKFPNIRRLSQPGTPQRIIRLAFVEQSSAGVYTACFTISSTLGESASAGGHKGCCESAFSWCTRTEQARTLFIGLLQNRRFLVD